MEALRGQGLPPQDHRLNSASLAHTAKLIISNVVLMGGVENEQLAQAIDLVFSSPQLGSYTLTGEAVIRKTLAPTVYSIMHVLGENAPETAYISLFLITRAIAKKHEEVASQLGKIDTGRRFLTEEKKEEARTREIKQEFFLGEQVQKLEHAERNFKSHNWGTDSSLYKAVLRVIADKTIRDYTSGERAKRGVNKDHVLALIAEGKIEEAKEKLEMLFGPIL